MCVKKKQKKKPSRINVLFYGLMNETQHAEMSLLDTLITRSIAPHNKLLKRGLSLFILL